MLIYSILTFKIKIKLINLFNLCSNLSRSFFCSLFNKEFKKIIAKRKSRVITKKEKEIEISINLISAKSIAIIYFNNIVARINLLRTLYFVTCSII